MKKPSSVAQVKKNRKLIRNANIVARERLSKLDKAALWVTEKVGTTGFFLVVLTWTAAWLSWNIFAPAKFQFDPFPAFVLWLFMSNVLQILLMPLIMVGQNLISKKATVKADHDHEIMLKSEQEIEILMEHQDYQNKLLEDILKKLDI